ncbi:MAG: hypothetical protein K2K72_04460, partial [Duncaniella sp.]|nr:hypothetical protein [Duncaniella sp.]
ILMLTAIENTFRGSLIDTTSGAVLFCHDIDNPRKGGGIEVWKGSDLHLWPSFIRNGAMYGLVEVSGLDENTLRRFNLQINKDVEANPYMVVIKPK